MIKLYHILSTVSMIVFIIIFCGAVTAKEQKTIVVTTSMLENIVREIYPENESIKIVRLIPPGSCPGHFDLSPKVAPTLKKAAVIIRHDFQGVLEDKVTTLTGQDIDTIAVTTPGSLLIPDNYSKLAVETASALTRIFPDDSNEISRRVTSVNIRMMSLSEKMQKQAEPWKDKPVIASSHQSKLCEWLGFHVTGVMNRPEDTTPRDISKLMSTDVDIVIGNLQEGTQSAVTLGKRMDVPVAILSNFPEAKDYGHGYDQLADINMNRILEAWRRR
ncbi:metal ABC transporter substrate-binding protein [Candidatus Latescibacterota bacterium]